MPILPIVIVVVGAWYLLDKIEEVIQRRINRRWYAKHSDPMDNLQLQDLLSRVYGEPDDIH